MNRKVVYTFLSFFTLVSCFQYLQAQDQMIPHQMTAVEQQKMGAYLHQLEDRHLISIPPPAPVRTMAEWEEVRALVITWAGQTTILKEIVRNAVKECKVMIVTTDSANVASQLTSAGIALDSVRFVDTPFNTIWVCDYGPTCVYKNDVDSLYLIDWTYNRPRPEDDVVPEALADFLHLPIYEATSAPYDWVHTGGNNLQNGMGTLFSSNLVLNENPEKTEAEIDTIAKKFLGINQYIKFPTLPYDGIHHLDMHMRLIDEETILFGQYPDGVSDGPQIESNIQYLENNFMTSFGHRFNIVRLPMPPDQNGRYPNNGGNYRTYTNAVFINKTLLVPTYQEKYDTTALRIYRENLPGYNVVGINCNSIIGQLGALHCITKLIGDDDPLLIAHARLRDIADTVAYYPVTAYIRHRDGIKDAELFYRTSKETQYSESPMMLIDSAANIWASLIPAYPAGTEVQYYIAAEANNGKHQVRPIVAPEGYFKFKVLGELPNQPPQVSITSPSDGSVISFDAGHTEITFNASDIDGKIAEADIYINGLLASTLDTLPYAFDWIFTTAGAYSIVVDVKDDDGATAVSDTVHVVVEDATGIEEIGANPNIRIYPNPANTHLSIKCALDNQAPLKIDIMDATGRRIYSDPNMKRELDMDVSGWVPGVYFIHAYCQDFSATFKVFKY